MESADGHGRVIGNDSRALTVGDALFSPSRIPRRHPAPDGEIHMPASWSRPTPSPCRLPLLQVRTAHLVKVLTHLLRFRQTSGREGTGVTPNPAGEGHLASHDGHQRTTPTALHPHSGARRDSFRQRPLAAGRPPPQRRHAPPYTCVAGRFTLLFAQPLVRIRRMRTDQVTLHPDGRVLVRFNTVPVDMPEHLARHGKSI